jgi:hypothetical protein
MNGQTRAAVTLLGAAVAGALLWLAAQIDRGSNGGYWATAGIVAGAGIVLALAQVRGRNGHPRAMLGLGFLPVLIAAGWVLLALQPHGNWFRDHVLAWSDDIGIGDVVRDVGTWVGVLAFGIGYTLGLALEPRARRAAIAAPVDTAAADEPATAERREVAQRPTEQPAEAETAVRARSAP